MMIIIIINIIIVFIHSFMMNGKGLCLMTMDMFSARAPLGGKTSSAHFLAPMALSSTKGTF